MLNRICYRGPQLHLCLVSAHSPIFLIKITMIGFTRGVYVNVSRSVLVDIKLQVDSLYTLPKALAAFCNFIDGSLKFTIGVQ